MTTPFDPAWQEWINNNLALGCDKEELTSILAEHGFCPLQIVSALQYLPQSPALITRMNQRLAGQEDAQSSIERQRQAFQAIDDVRLAGATRIRTDKAHIYLLEHFLTDEDCDQLVRRIRQSCRPSTLTCPDTVADKGFRTSKTCELSTGSDAFIQALDCRIADYMGFEAERSEGIQCQYYQTGDEFKTHTDFFEPDTSEYEEYAGSSGQRTWSFMIYLNEVEEGGVTEFPALDLAVAPRKGRALIWNSLHPDGQVNRATAHWATPVIRGEKFVITKWFRTHGSLNTLYSKC